MIVRTSVDALVGVFAAVAALAVLQLSIGPDDASASYATASAAVLIAAVSRGLPAGLAATLAASIGVTYGRLPPLDDVAIASLNDLLGLALFMSNGILISAVAAHIAGRARPGGNLGSAVVPWSIRQGGPSTRRDDHRPRVVQTGPMRAAAALSPERLTGRELEVLSLLCDGHRNAAIAAHLFISGNTVKTHLKSVYGKLGVTTRTEATLRAMELGILELSEPRLTRGRPEGHIGARHDRA